MDEQLQQILQQQLRDVHLPTAISWWPLSIAWWLIIVLSLTLIAYLSYRLIKKHNQNRYRKAAHHELQNYFSSWQSNDESGAYLQAANELLKRCVIRFEPNMAKLSGHAWVATLERYSANVLSEQTQSALASAVYQADPKVDVNALHQELCQWLKRHKLGAKHV